MWPFKNSSTSTSTLADLAEKKPQLLSGQWSLCSHSRYGYGSGEQVSDETGTYLKVKGDCRDCKGTVVAIREIQMN